MSETRPAPGAPEGEGRDDFPRCWARLPDDLLPEGRVGRPLCTRPAGHDGGHQHDPPSTGEHWEWDNTPAEAYERGYMDGRHDLAQEMQRLAAAVKEARRG